MPIQLAWHDTAGIKISLSNRKTDSTHFSIKKSVIFFSNYVTFLPANISICFRPSSSTFHVPSVSYWIITNTHDTSHVSALDVCLLATVGRCTLRCDSIVVIRFYFLKLKSKFSSSLQWDCSLLVQNVGNVNALQFLVSVGGSSVASTKAYHLFWVIACQSFLLRVIVLSVLLIWGSNFGLCY